MTVSSNDWDKIIQTVTGSLMEYGAFTSSMQQELESLKAKRSAEIEEAKNNKRDVLIALIAFTGALLVAVIGLIFYTVHRLSSRLSVVIGATESMAKGDLSALTQLEGHDEAAEVSRAVHDMQTRLRGVIRDVCTIAESVAAASSEIAHGNQDLSTRTESQAGALEQSASSMAELQSQVIQNTEGARKANEVASTASGIAEVGGEVVGRVVETMKAIHDSSRKIGDIISVIDGIAFQTNILALNAAVEAARAGEQGRGFAVVASEVRSLAGRSADAAREIKSLITASVERVEYGSTLVDEAGATMTEVVSAIKKVNVLVSEISQASEVQSARVTLVGDAVHQMDLVTQQNAALVEEIAAAADSLKNQAGGLVNAVSVFKLDNVDILTHQAALGM